MRISETKKTNRRKKLLELVNENPFLTDEELAEKLKVSVPTIRLDRAELGIPEVRIRVKKMATDTYDQIRSMDQQDLIGELIKLKLEDTAVSKLHTTDYMTLGHSKIVRAHYLFAQANSLAVAMINSPAALTASSRVRFKRPVKAGEILTAQAEVSRNKDRWFWIHVRTRSGEETVFKGVFVIYAMKKGENND